MIDIHSHLLPGLDDGSRTLGQSIAVLRRMAADGVTGLVLTPHLSASQINAGAEDQIARRDATLEQLRPHCPREVALHPGFEIMLDQPLSPLALGDRRLSLAGSRYYLVEFPLSVVGEIATPVLREIVRTGVVPVVAHPERYGACSASTVAEWRAQGARVQVDARAVARPTTRGHRARELLAHSLADVIAADNHGDGRSLLTAVDFIRARSGGLDVAEEALRLLTHLNPMAMTNDWALAAVPQVVLAERLLDRVRRFVSG